MRGWTNGKVAPVGVGRRLINLFIKRINGTSRVRRILNIMVNKRRAVSLSRFETADWRFEPFSLSHMVV